MALNGLFCADVPLRNYSLTHLLSWRMWGFSFGSFTMFKTLHSALHYFFCNFCVVILPLAVGFVTIWILESLSDVFWSFVVIRLWTALAMILCWNFGSVNVTSCHFLWGSLSSSSFDFDDDYALAYLLLLMLLLLLLLLLFMHTDV